MDICTHSRLRRAHGGRRARVHARIHTSRSIYSFHPSSGTLVSKLRAFPAAKLRAITRPCLTPLGPRTPPHMPTAPSFLSTLPLPTAHAPSLPPSSSSIPQKESSLAQYGKGSGHFSPYGNFISKNSKPCPRLVVNLPLGIARATECHRQGWARESRQLLPASGKVLSTHGPEPRTVLPRTSGGGLGWGHIAPPAHPHPSCLLVPRDPGAGVRDCWWLRSRGQPGFLHPQVGPTCPQAGTPRGMSIFRGRCRQRMNSAKYPFSWEARRCGRAEWARGWR